MNIILHAENSTHAGEWQSAPPVWDVPPVDFNNATSEKISSALSLLPATTDFSTIVVEEFWTLFVQLAATDYPGAIQALQDAPESARGGTLKQWAHDPLNFQAEIPLSGTVSFARDQQLLEYAGSIPCLLSAPAAMDLSVDFDQFIQRIEEYQYYDVPVLVTDLYMALLRIDFRNTSEQQIEAASSHLNITVRLDSATTTTVNLAQLCHRFQAGAAFSKNEAFGLDASTNPISMFFTKCLQIDPETVPIVDDADDRLLQWQHAGGDESVGLYAQQVALRRHVLAPATLINLVAIQRITAKGHLAGSREALLSAWQHGLLDPWRVDISLLDWSPKLEKIPSLVTALVELAHAGLLSLTWQILDEILGYATEYSGRKLGMVEVVRAMEALLPTVLHSVAESKAPQTALDLPGLRAFAELAGRSKAIVAAKDLVESIGASAKPDAD